MQPYSNECSYEFVRDTAIERRNLSKAQRVDIVLRSEILIDSLMERAKNNSLNNLKQNKPKGPVEPVGNYGRTNKANAMI